MKLETLFLLSLISDITKVIFIAIAPIGRDGFKRQGLGGVGC